MDLKPEDFLVYVTFQPYLIPYNKEEEDFGKPFPIDREYSHMRGMKKRMKELTESALYGGFKMKKYKFDEDNLLIHVTLEWTPLYRDDKTDEEDILEYLDDMYGNKYQMVGNGAPDTWLEGDQVIYEDDEASYEFGISTREVEIVRKRKSSSKDERKSPAKNVKSERKSPSESATAHKIGTVMIGNDGNKWVVRKGGKSQRWYRY